jgi:hypothetical protein
MRRLLLAALAAALVAPGPAHAADPIMALSEVQAGMHCTGLSVVRGVTISPFDVDVIDVIDRGRPGAARIVVRVSGPAVDATGVGPGFSGSPILCTDADGVARNIGAIADTIGEYGGHTVLATPIEAILAQPPLPPAATRSVIGARSLAGPLTIAGVSPGLGRALERAARRAGRTLIASPVSGSSVDVPPQTLRPGSAVAVGLSSGDVVLGAIGTVAYVDGPKVWIFGHGLDDAGRRSLFLQDAYIHTVISNPLGVPDVSTYKLGSPGNDLGTITSDGPNGVAGVLGVLPPSFPLRVTAKDLDSGLVRSGLTQLADEGDVGLPTGASPLAIAAVAATAEATSAILAGAPARQTGDLCVKVTLRELRAPLRACNTYAVDGSSQNALAGEAVADVSAAVGVVESYRFGVLHPTGAEIAVRVRRGLRQAYLQGVSGPATARRGSTIALRLKLRRTGSGKRSERIVRMHVPRGAPTGLRTVVLKGTAAEQGGDPDSDSGDLGLLFESQDGGPDDGGPASLSQLRSAFSALARYTGVTARLAGEDRRLVADPRLRISGEARMRLRIR